MKPAHKRPRPPSLDSPQWREQVQVLVDGIRAGRLAVDDLRAWAAAGSLAAVEALARIGGNYAGRVR